MSGVANTMFSLSSYLAAIKKNINAISQDVPWNESQGFDEW